MFPVWSWKYVAPLLFIMTWYAVASPVLDGRRPRRHDLMLGLFCGAVFCASWLYSATGDAMRQQVLHRPKDFAEWAAARLADLHNGNPEPFAPDSYPCVVVWYRDHEYDDLNYTYVYPFGD